MTSFSRTLPCGVQEVSESVCAALLQITCYLLLLLHFYQGARFRFELLCLPPTSPERHCVEEGGYVTYCGNGINLSVLYEYNLFKFCLSSY